MMLKITLCVSGTDMQFTGYISGFANVNIGGHLTPTQSHRNRHKYRYKTNLIYFHILKIKGFKTAKFEP